MEMGRRFKYSDARWSQGSSVCVLSGTFTLLITIDLAVWAGIASGTPMVAKTWNSPPPLLPRCLYLHLLQLPPEQLHSASIHSGVISHRSVGGGGVCRRTNVCCSGHLEAPAKEKAVCVRWTRYHSSGGVHLEGLSASNPRADP
jgi:hypothetical protein